MTTTIVPISERRPRLPVAGRIRLGIKVPFVNSRGERRTKPVALDTFRFTSRHEDDIIRLAEMYGGEPKGWKDSKSEDRFEVISTSSEIRVALPPEPLGDSFYELYGGKGMERQCDGVTCSTTVNGPHGPEPADKPCVCRERGVKECKPMLRLAVLIPELRLRGVWRMHTSSEAALDELPGMVSTLQHLQGEGLTEGLLRLEKRQSQGGRQHFVVPALGIAESLEGLIAGRARLAALPAAEPGPGVEAGFVRPFTALPPGPDDEVVDAELLDEPSAAEKARQLRTARHQAVLEGREPPTSWDEL